MKILITGGAGFIASNIADRFLELGHEVVIVDNMITGQRENIPAAATFYEMDICDPGIKNVFETERPDLVCHHAAQMCDDCRSRDVGGRRGERGFARLSDGWPEPLSVGAID